MNKECEIEHFGFTAEQSSLERKYFLQKIIRNALDALVNKFNANEKTCELLSRAKEEVFENMWKSMKDEIMSLDNLDTKYFTIPDHVLLPPYFDHVNSYTEQNEEELDRKLDTLKKNFLENTVMLASLNLENLQHENLSNFVENEIKIQQQLKESFANVCMDTVDKLVGKTNKLVTNENNLVDSTHIIHT